MLFSIRLLKPTGKGLCLFSSPIDPPAHNMLLFSCQVMSNSVTPRPVAHQAPLSLEFSRQEYWSGLPFPSPGDLPDSGTEPRGWGGGLPHCGWTLYYLSHQWLSTKYSRCSINILSKEWMNEKKKKKSSEEDVHPITMSSSLPFGENPPPANTPSPY